MLKLGNRQKANAFYGSRAFGQELRFEVEEGLSANERVVLDFSNVGVVTQSYIDEAIGVLILQFGPEILERLSFKNCNDDIKAVLGYVANTRCEDFLKNQPATVH